MKSKTEKFLAELNAENGPVYAKSEDLEIVQPEEGEVEVAKNNFGCHLNITLKDKSRRMVTIRDSKPEDLEKLQASKFSLAVWEAQRTLPAQGNRREIPKGAQRVFATAA